MRIFKKIKKKIFLLALLLIGWLFVFNNNFFGFRLFNIQWVSAAEVWETNNQTQAEKEKAENDRLLTIQNISQRTKVIYMIIMSTLSIAAAAMDNSLVYGSIFHLDVPLWKFWNMMNQFANYVLWFIFLTSILMSFFGWGEKMNPKKVLPKLLIWAVLVQASWFIIAALIDISTIATYSLWAMPLNILNQDSFLWETPILKVNNNMDLTDIAENGVQKKEIITWYSYWTENFVPCKVAKQTEKQSSEKPDDSTKSDNSLKIIWWDEFQSWMQTFFPKTENQSNNININTSYCVLWYWWTHLVPVPAESEELTNSVLYWDSWLFKQWKDYLESMKTNDDSTPTLNKLIKSWRWFKWVFYALYASFLQTADLTYNYANKSIGWVAIEAVVKIVIALLLVIPLWTLIIILIMRVVVLWMVIWFSPLLMLGWVFDFEFLKKNEKAAKDSILWLIFLPVWAAFGLSISIIFLTLITSWLPNSSTPALEELLYWKQEAAITSASATNTSDEKCMDWWITKLCWSRSDVNTWISWILDSFSWIAINLFGIALMWAVVFATMKTSKVTNAVVDKIQWFSKSMLKAMPIVPVPWVGPMSVGWLQRWLQHLEQIPGTIQRKQFTEQLQPFFDRFEAKHSEELKKLKEDLKSAKSAPAIWWQVQNMDKRGYMLNDYSNEFAQGLRNTWYSVGAGVSTADWLIWDKAFASFVKQEWKMWMDDYVKKFYDNSKNWSTEWLKKLAEVIAKQWSLISWSFGSWMELFKYEDRAYIVQDKDKIPMSLDLDMNSKEDVDRFTTFIRTLKIPKLDDNILNNISTQLGFGSKIKFSWNKANVHIGKDTILLEIENNDVFIRWANPVAEDNKESATGKWKSWKPETGKWDNSPKQEWEEPNWDKKE